jgi:sulfate adenylyltransferase subunit 2
MDPTLPPAARAAARKTAGLKVLIAREGLKGILVGIRRDEQGTRGKERVFSPRDESGGWNYRQQPAELWDQYQTRVDARSHVRVHPLLHWTELDIWRYHRRENIPFVPAYLARDGKRYRSIGERNITTPPMKLPRLRPSSARTSCGSARRRSPRRGR